MFGGKEKPNLIEIILIFLCFDGSLPPRKTRNSGGLGFTDLVHSKVQGWLKRWVGSKHVMFLDNSRGYKGMLFGSP